MNQSASAVPEIPGNSPVRILKMAPCPSLSGRSTLTYHVGCTPESESPAILFRVFANSGGGFFSNEWVELSEVQNAFAKVPGDIAITAHVLSPLFQGKSANNQSFLFAVLKHEGLVSTLPDSKGRYGRADAGKFMAEVEALMASDVDLKVVETPAKVELAKPQKSVPEKARNGDIKAKPVVPKSVVSGKKSAKKVGNLQGSAE